MAPYRPSLQRLVYDLDLLNGYLAANLSGNSSRQHIFSHVYISFCAIIILYTYFLLVPNFLVYLFCLILCTVLRCFIHKFPSHHYTHVSHTCRVAFLAHLFLYYMFQQLVFCHVTYTSFLPDFVYLFHLPVLCHMT